jgi:hypothetical protein
LSKPLKDLLNSKGEFIAENQKYNKKVAK